MITTDEFLALVGRMVADVAPTEKMAFDVAGPKIAEMLYSGEDVDVALTQRRASEFHFLDDASHVLQFVSLMAGTFGAIQKVATTLKSSPKVDLEDKLIPRWTAELRTAGLSDQTASQVATRFAADLAAMMRRK